MILSRRHLLQSALALGGASALGLGTAQAEPGPGEMIPLWPSTPAGALHPQMPEIIEQTSAKPDYSSRRRKGILTPHMIARPAASPNGAAMLIIPGGGFAWTISSMRVTTSPTS